MKKITKWVLENDTSDIIKANSKYVIEHDIIRPLKDDLSEIEFLISIVNNDVNEIEFHKTLISEKRSIIKALQILSKKVA